MIAKSIKVTNPIAKKNQTIPKNSLLNVYFVGKQYQADQLDNFVFGVEDDEFDYKKNTFLQFSIAFGLGEPPEETLSMTLKIVIGIGLGLPMMLFIISIMYTIIQKFRSPNDFTVLRDESN